jgi:hypothetical protein
MESVGGIGDNLQSLLDELSLQKEPVLRRNWLNTNRPKIFEGRTKLVLLNVVDKTAPIMATMKMQQMSC